jgi:Tol biopolymer transport system component
MEHVEGKTLRDFVGATSKVAPLKDIIEYALQIAEALEAAHNKGVIHRDIKSENIMVSETNQIKVMDFGLAKLKGSLKLTKTSSTVGTLAYMAPEVIEGKETDARSDIFSFGVLLYEMLTGRLPFTGEYESALMYSIINDDPEPVENFRTDISSELIHILNRSLEKDPEDRYQTMHDVVIDLSRVKRDSSKVSRKSLKEMPVPEVSRETKEVVQEIKPKRKIAYIVSIALISILTLIIFSIYIFKPFSDTQNPQRETSLFGLTGHIRFPALSPDGKKIAFSWRKEYHEDEEIYIQLVGTGSPQPRTDHPGRDFSPVWSQNGDHLAFFRDFKGKTSIIRKPFIGGKEDVLINLNRIYMYGDKLSWSPDGQFLAFSDVDSVQKIQSIYTLSVDNLEIQPLTFPPPGYKDYHPIYSPDGKKLAFLRGPTLYISDIWVLPLSGGDPERITTDNAALFGLAWTADSRDIVFSSSREGVLNLWRLKASGGEPTQITFSAQSDCVWPTISLLGQPLAFVSTNWNSYISTKDLTDPHSLPSRLSGSSSRGDIEPQYSPSGAKIVFKSFRTGRGHIWVCDSDGENRYQLTFLRSLSGAPIWHPNEPIIAFDSNDEGHTHIYTINMDRGKPIKITSGKSNNHIPSWSRDGESIYFRSDRTGEQQIWKIPKKGGEPEQITFGGGHSAFESFDGKWIYYTKGETHLGQSGIWKKSLQVDTDVIVVDRPVNYRNWALMENGIYYVYPTGMEYNVEFYNFKNENITEICRLKGMDMMGISISPDRRQLLFSKRETQSDISLIENFR